MRFTAAGAAARSGLRLSVGLITLATLAIPRRASAQDEHEHLHFSHPMVTESPSPDTKLRFDVIQASTGRPSGLHATTLRAEGEYGFTESLSLAVVAPYVRITSPPLAKANSLGNIEAQLKAASFRWAEAGFLLGGGVTAALPTGNEEKGIGSGHIFEVEPFVDAAYKSGRFEGVSFLSLSSTFRERAGEERERYARLDVSTLYRVALHFELLGELTTSRALYGEERGTEETFIAPGFKFRPGSRPALAVGLSGVFGVGTTSGTKAVQVTAFYHF